MSPNSAIRQIDRLFGQGTAIGLTDAQLLERFAAARDESSFELLMARHGPMVSRVCRGVLRDRHEAEDAFQAAFLVLARKARSLWVKGSLASWLYRIALRIALQARDDATRRRRHERLAADGREMVVQSTATFEPDVIPILWQEVERLPEKYRAPVVLCHLEELTHEAAARMLGCPVGTVHGRLSRARALLRRRLSRRGVTFTAGSAAAVFGAGDLPAAAVPVPLRDATLRAARNLAAGQGVAAAVGSASVAALLAGALRAMTVRTLKASAAVALTVGVLAGASLLAARSPAGMRQNRPLPTRFDEDVFQRVLPECRTEPLFIDFEGHRLLSPPSAPTAADERRPLSPGNLEFSDDLKTWIRLVGADMAIQADGRTVTLAGLEAEDGEPVPGSTDWENLGPADALARVDRLHPDRARRSESKTWPRFVRTFQVEDGALVLPFLTREGSIGLLELTKDRTNPKRPDAIRLTYLIDRGSGPEDDARGKRPRRTILDDLTLPGPLTFEARDGKMVVWRPGSPEWIELDRGKVLVRVNRAPRPDAGPADRVETVLAASRIAGEEFDLDGRDAQLKILGPRQEAIYWLSNDRTVTWTFHDPTGQVVFDDVYGADRWTVELPDLRKVSKDPGVPYNRPQNRYLR
jgi:RNA polymerase sigma factor (sigma-70 family)